jgi:predicted cupin superfamily sugar epimerase
VTVPALDLAPHPEGGWYRRTWTSGVTIETPHGPRASATAILYLLDGVSRRHRVRSAELWCRHGGSPDGLSGYGPAGAPPTMC